MCNKISYSEKLKDPRWQKKRLEILDWDDFKCSLCKDDTRTLHVHHLKYYKNPWDAPNSELTTLCEHCHSVLHYAEKEEFVNFSEITKVLKKPLFVDGKYNNNIITVFVLTDQLRAFQIENKSVVLLFRMTKNTINDLYGLINE